MDNVITMPQSANGHQSAALTSVGHGLSIMQLQQRHRTFVDVYKIVTRAGYSPGDLVLETLPMVATVRPVLKEFEEAAASENWEERMIGLTHYITKIATAWSVTYGLNSDGTPVLDEAGVDISQQVVPFTQDNVDKLPSLIQGDIMAALFESFKEGEETA